MSGIGNGERSIVELSKNTLVNLKSMTIGDDGDNEIAESMRHDMNENPQSNITIVVDWIL